MEFDVAAEEVGGGTWVVAVGGELDLYTAPDVEQELFAAVGRGATCVVVDLERATFVDSVAMGVLVHVDDALRRGGCRLVVATGPVVGRFFEIAGLDRRLALYGERADALAALGR